MKVLNNSEINQVSGGEISTAVILGATALTISVVNFMLIMNQSREIRKTDEYVTNLAMMGLYHDLQLSGLAGYDSVNSLSIDTLLSYY